MLEVLPQTLQRLQLSQRLRQFGLRFGHIDRARAIGQRILSFLFGALGGGFI